MHIAKQMSVSVSIVYAKVMLCVKINFDFNTKVVGSSIAGITITGINHHLKIAMPSSRSFHMVNIYGFIDQLSLFVLYRWHSVL